MKKHLINIWFDTPGSRTGYSYKGYVTGKEFNGKIVISPAKIFKQAFGFEIPDYTKISLI